MEEEEQSVVTATNENLQSAEGSESIASSTNILSSSENTNKENREKELLTQPIQKKNDEAKKRVAKEEEEHREKEAADGKSESVKNEGEKSTEFRKDIGKNVKTDDGDETENESVDDNGKTIPEMENPSSDEYAKNVTYDAEGVAIYTDPKTNYQYKWSEEKNTWDPIESSANPYENEHYRWCSETNQWIPKSTAANQTGENLENEYYKWDKDSNQWVPKTQSANVTYGYEDGVRTYTDQDGAVYFWDVEKKAWFPKIDDDFMARYQLNYGFIDNTSTSSSSTTPTATTSTTSGNGRTEKNIDSSLTERGMTFEDYLETSMGETSEFEGSEAKPAAPVKRKAPAEPPKWFDLPPEQNTKVYVSNLPLDITEEEFIQVMSKCGLIMRDPQTNKNKIKLYAEADGQLKGDGLCDYIKVESVDLALDLLDGYDVRGQKIKVQRAKFQMRGEYNPALKPKKKKKDKEKLLKMKEKLFDWRPEKMRGERSKHERVVIIKNLFSPELFDKEVHLIIDYQNDLREECKKCGTVRKVVLYDRHPEGIAQITMSDPEEADLVVQMMNGRFFGKRKLIAEIWDGKTKYKIGETEAEIKQRLTNWDKYLETGEKSGDIEKEKSETKPEKDD